MSCTARRFLLENRICRWVDGKLVYFSRLICEARGGFIMTKTFTIKEGQKPTEKQLQEVREAKKRAIEFDEDCPELSPAMHKAFRCSVIQRNRRKEA